MNHRPNRVICEARVDVGREEHGSYSAHVAVGEYCGGVEDAEASDVQSRTVADEPGERTQRISSRLNRIELGGRKTVP